jgi:hypothetical protein
MEEYNFYIKINDGYVFKNIIDVLYTSLKELCFDLSAEGIKLTMMDTHKNILFNLDMNRSEFQPYHYNYPSKNKQIGVVTKHFQTMLTSIKKKDKIIIYITKQDPYKMHIDIIPKESFKTIKTIIAINNHQNIVSEIPSGYESYIIMNTQEYQKTVKELKQVSGKIYLHFGDGCIQFSADIPHVYNKDTIYGDVKGKGMLLTQEFSLDYLLKIVKLSCINKQMKIYSCEGKPLFVNIKFFDTCSLGVYIKPGTKEQA